VIRRAALLRAVNVGGRKLPMPDLRRCAEAIGLHSPRTLLASGNLVFEADGSVAELEPMLEEAVAERCGLRTEFLVRDLAEIDAIIAANPFPEAAQERPSRLVVHFHREPLPADYASTLLADRTGSEEIAQCGRELYVDYRDGIGTSTLDRTMKLVRFRRLNTARNWNTVVKLRYMLRD
jgi:uncharacterized protein (DUF1697 family)